VSNDLSGKDLVSAGLPRSGSTLIYQTLKWLFPSARVRKVQGFLEGVDYSLCVCSYRNFIDATISQARIDTNSKITSVDIKKAAKWIKKNVGDVKRYRDTGKCLMLNYSLFYNDYDYLFRNYSMYFKVSFCETQTKSVRLQSSLESNMRRASLFKDFSEYDRETHIHGRHIKSPRPKEARKLVTLADIEFLRGYFEEDLKEFGYDESSKL